MRENDAASAMAVLHDWCLRTADGETAGPDELGTVIERGRPALDAEPPGGLAHRMLALAHQSRWEHDRTHFDDADHAITLWQHVLGAHPGDPSAAYMCGTLLAHRAERTRERGDIAEAVRLADVAVRTLDDADAWYLSGWTHSVRAFSGGEPDALAEALHRFGTALRRGPDHGQRCRIIRGQVRAAFIRCRQGRLTPAALRGHVDRGHDLLAAPGDAGLPDQALLAGTLAMVEVGTAQSEGRAHDFTRVRALLDRYRDVALPDPHLRAELDAAQAELDQIAGTAGDLDRGVATVARLAASDRFSAEQRDSITGHLGLLRAGRAVNEGDLAALDTALEQLRAASDPAMQDLAAVLTAVREARGPAGAGDGTGADPVAALSGLIAGISDDPPGTPLAAAGRVTVLAAAVHTAAGQGDTATLRRLAAEAGPLLGHIPDDYPMLKVPAYRTAGVAELEVARHDPADHQAAARAAAHLAAACALAGGPHHPLWPQLAVAYGQSLRIGVRPDRAGSRELGRSALLSLTWQALIQADTGRALESAAAAARHVGTVAAWCAEDAADPAATSEPAAADPSAAADLVAVLDAGRGLALHAATASRSMPDRLTAAGHPDLAATWRDTGGLGHTPDDNLRVRALHALTADSGLFSSPGPAQIRQALTTVGADALTYLVPAGGTRPGMAVVVPVAGQVRVLTLPGLHTGRTPGGWFGSGRDLGPADGETGDDAFDDMCRWAWSACMEPIAALTEQWHLRRPARLVLVPTGALSLVPWHAASYDDRSGRHFAIERLVVSYSVSARMFHDTAGHPLRSPQSALIVGDPRGDLRFAAAEALAVHRDFHPGGTLLSRATADDVLDWIAKPGRGPSLLHLACHGHADPARPAGARLALTGGDLPVLRLLAKARSAGLDLDRVVLSACSTGAVGSLHDEAVSLASAFLAGGAHTVIGSLWAVPDADTARLMYLLHHHLTVGEHAPADALRLAQLAMLDPAPGPVPSLPPELAAAGGSGHRAWAAFFHLGR